MIEMSLLNAFIHLIQTVGFPIAIAIYLLWSYDKKIEKTQNETQATLTGESVGLLQDMNTSVQVLKDRPR